jgi:hypothetical protein
MKIALGLLIVAGIVALIGAINRKHPDEEVVTDVIKDIEKQLVHNRTNATSKPHEQPEFIIWDIINNDYTMSPEQRSAILRYFELQGYLV